MILFHLFWINIYPENVSVLFKFTQGFYTIFILLVITAFFSKPYIILINFSLIFFTTTRTFFFALKNFPDEIDLIRPAYFIHTLVLLGITLVLYLFKKHTNNSILKANEESIAKELKIEELTATEEKLRASTEELQSTTDALKGSYEDISKALKKVEESDQLKTEFIQNMSNEIRTPMNGILGFSSLLANAGLSQELQKQYIEIIHSSGNQLMNIINDILEISKLQSNQIEPAFKKFDLNQFFNNLHSIFEIKANEKNIELNYNINQSNEHFDIWADEQILSKILNSLIENAIKFTNEGHIEFGYSILKRSADQQIEIYVKDTGIGIKPENLQRIFIRFSQEDKTVSRKAGGLGLGLAIAKENAELLEGNIRLESAKDKGSTFYVTIPYKTAESS